VILVSAILIVVFSLGSAELNSAGRKLGEYYALLVALTLGMVLMAGASNLLMMYLALECRLSVRTSWRIHREASDSSEASLKYVIYGAFSSGLMLYGVSIIYGLAGSLDIYTINQNLPSVLAAGGSATFMLLIAGVLTLVGFGYKISAVPFHFWARTCTKARRSRSRHFWRWRQSRRIRDADPVPQVTFIDNSAAALPAGAWATLQGFEWTQIIAALSVLTMTLGNVVAICRTT